MGPFAIVLIPPCGDLFPRIDQIPKPVCVQTFIPQPSIEALHEGILDWLYRGRSAATLSGSSTSPDLRRVRGAAEALQLLSTLR